MAKIIEIMGPAAVGKTTILKEIQNHYKGDKTYGFISYKKKQPQHWIEKLSHSIKFKYIITEDRFFYHLILVEKGLARKIASDETILFQQETLKEDGIKDVLEQFPFIYMMINFKCNENIILERMKTRPAGIYYNYLDSDEDKLRAIKNVMNYIDTVARVFERNGVYVYEIDTSLEIDENVKKIKDILDYHKNLKGDNSCG